MDDSLPIDVGPSLPPPRAAPLDLVDDLTVAEYAESVARAGANLVSVIVPCANDRRWLPGCFERLATAFAGSPYTYEILVIDDHSHDGSAAYVRSQEGKLPVRLLEKHTKKGRALSIKEGLNEATGARIVLLDPDLRCSPEAFRAMLAALDHSEIVVANRATYPFYAYKLFSTMYRFIFGHLLLSVDADVRSGLKMFRRSLFDDVRFDPEFDLRFGFDAFLLYHAKRSHWTIEPMTVAYTRPLFHHGVIQSVTSRFALAQGIVSIVAAHVNRVLFPFLYPPEPQEYFEAGFTNINDYLFLAPEQSAKGHLTREVYFLMFYGSIILALYFWLVYAVTGKDLGWIFFLHVSLIQFALILFKIHVLSRTLRLAPPPSPLPLRTDDWSDLPMISVILPVYKEKDILPQLCERMAAMEYPIEKLDIIFIFESTDTDTILSFQNARPPTHFKGLISPDVQPKTKPKALNVALRETKGDLLVIFDAETLPEVDQFRKVVAAFRADPTLDYVHSRIDVYNPNVNWITKMYTAEFAFFYNYFLPGLATLHSPTPISGHSTYFRREHLIKVGGWDSYNLAEDCDIGIRLFRKGYKNAIVIDSYSWEQSTTTLADWIRQRTRWMQGFVQTSMVNLRFPALLWKDLGGLRNFLIFMFHVPGGVFINGLNLLQWIMLIFWFITEDPVIQAIFSDVLLYIAVASFILGNILFTYFNLLGLFYRHYYSIVKFALFSFVYWFMLSFATARAILRFFKQESTWDKTNHPLLALPSEA